MRKIIAFIVCAVLVCTMPLVAFAEEVSTDPVDTAEVVTEEQVTETEEVTETEAVTEEVTEEVTETETERETETEEVAGVTDMLTTDMIVGWIEENFEEISVIVSLVIMIAFQVIKHTALNKSVALCNNNAVSIVENSNDAIDKALAKIESVSDVVDSYKEQITNLLSEIRRSDEEKKKLEKAFANAQTYLLTAKLANKELANEVAELLVLANIPNSKKEELYARHRAAVAAIDEADIKTTEVMDNVGEEA